MSTEIHMPGQYRSNNESIFVSDTAGHVSAEWIEPPGAKALLTLAHGAGAGMHHPFMVSLAQQLAINGIASLRFNFPFSEHGKRRPDAPAVAMATVAAAMAYVRARKPGMFLFLAGKSFGGRMSSQWFAQTQPANVQGLVFFGFPLHPAGKPATVRAQHLPMIQKPMLFLQGTRDALADLELMRKTVKVLPGAQLKEMAGADHSFKTGKRYLTTELAALTASWLEAQTAPLHSSY